MRTVFIILAAIALVLGAAAVVFYFAGDEVTTAFQAKQVVSEPEQIDQTAMGFVSPPYKDSYGMSRVTGYVDNVGEKDIASVNLEVQLYDSGGQKKELVKYTVVNVPVGSRKSFDANAGPLDGPRNAEVTISSIEVIE